MILGIKVGRRMWAAVGLRDEDFVSAESRYVSVGNGHQAPFSHFQRLLEQLAPAVVYVYAPGREANTEAISAEIVRQLEAEAVRRGISLKILSRSDVLGSFGLVSLKTRKELVQAMQAIWPAIGEAKRERQVVLAEAAAAALVGDLRERWPPV